MSADLTLSDRQESILVYIIRYLRENKIPPSIRNIGEAVGISSTSVVNYNLTKLQEIGLIDRTPEVSRGLSVNFEQVERTLSGLLTNNGSPNGLIRVPVFGHIQAGLPVDVPDVRNWQTAGGVGAVDRRDVRRSQPPLCPEGAGRLHEGCRGAGWGHHDPAPSRDRQQRRHGGRLAGAGRRDDPQILQQKGRHD